MNEPPRDYIEHDPDEPPRDMTGNGVYWAGGAILIAIWAVYFFLGTIDWESVMLGGLTGGMFILAMIEYTGNKVPKWMRR